MFRKLLNKKGDLSGPIFAIIMIVIVLLCVPAFRALMVDTSWASCFVGYQIVNITTPEDCNFWEEYWSSQYSN